MPRSAMLFGVSQKVALQYGILITCPLFADTLVFHFQLVHDGHLPDGPCGHDSVADSAQ